MTGHAEGTFIPVATLGDLDARGRTVVQVGDARVALVTVEGRLHALDDACPHRGGLHAWPFDVRTGRCPRIPGVGVRIYEVRVDGERILVAASGSFPAR